MRVNVPVRVSLGGNIDSRVTDGLILHICSLSVHVFYAFVSMCVSCSL